METLIKHYKLLVMGKKKVNCQAMVKHKLHTSLR